MGTDIAVTYDQNGGQTVVILNYVVSDTGTPEKGVFREPFTQSGLEKLRRDYESLPAPRRVRWVSPEKHLPFPPVLKLFIKKTFRLFDSQ